MVSITISEVVKAVGGVAVGNYSENNLIYDISTDTRTIKKGSLFVAIKGDNFDGHSFVEKAFENEATAVLVQEQKPNANGVQIVVKDTRQALLDLSGYYLSLFKLPVVAITGSVGKTTTKDMVSAVLSTGYNTHKTKGNFNNQIGTPKTIFEIDEKVQMVVLEMGMDNFKQIESLSVVAKPNCAVISKIGVSHIETLGSQEGILQAKLEVLCGMDINSPIILNGDDEYLVGAKNKIKQPVIYFGINNEVCDIVAKNIKENLLETTFDVVDKRDNQTFSVTIPTIGVHNVYDALSAVAVGKVFNLSNENIAKGLSNYTPSGMRQKIVNASGIVVIEDCYNASPDSVKASLSALTSIKADGKKIAVFGDMLELGSVSVKGHIQSGIEAKNANVDLLLTYGNNSKDTTAKAKELGVKSENFLDKKELLQTLLKKISKGDVVLFKGSRGMKLEEIIEELYKVFPKE